MLILRDLLVPDALLAATGTRAEVVDVGRRCGSEEGQAARQARINALMRDGWQAGRRVVRLKSGDPLVFGRAAEEARFLRRAWHSRSSSCPASPPASPPPASPGCR